MNRIPRINKLLAIVVTIVSVFLILGLVNEYVTGGSGLFRVLLQISIFLATVIVTWVIYLNNKGSVLLKYVPMILFLTAYTYSMFTTAHWLTYPFMFFLIILLSTYDDKKLTITVCILAFSIVVGRIIVNLVVTENYFVDYRSEIIIYTLASLVFVISAIFSMTLKLKFNKESQALLDTKQEEQDKIISGLTEIINNMQNATITGESIADSLTSSVESTNEDTSTLLDFINSKAENTIDTLNKSVNDVKHNYSTIAKQIDILQEQFANISSYATYVSDIASQTNMLALNASVESVRAGDSGAGFSVVADEVKSLAGQSRGTAIEIETTIESLNESMADMQQTITNLKNVGLHLDKATADTSELYSEIKQRINSINHNVDNVNNQTKNLLDSNESISDTVKKAVILVETDKEESK